MRPAGHARPSLTTRLPAALPAVALLMLSSSASSQASADYPKDASPAAVAAWLPRHSSVRPAEVVVIAGGRVVAITSRKSIGLGTAQSVSVTLRTEIIDPKVAAAGIKSEISTIDVECQTRRAKLSRIETYTQWGLRGAKTVGPGWTQWESAGPDTVIGQVVAASCDRTFRGPFAEAKVAASEPARPPAKPAALPAKPVPAPAAPPPAAKAVAPPATGGRAAVVQIAAADSRAQAQAALDRLRSKSPGLLAGRKVMIEEVTVGGRVFHRAMIGDFGDSAQATSLCNSIKASGGDCIVRRR